MRKILSVLATPLAALYCALAAGVAIADDIDHWKTLAQVGLAPQTGLDNQGHNVYSISDSIPRRDFYQRMMSIHNVFTLDGSRREVTIQDRKSFDEYMKMVLDNYLLQESIKSKVNGANANASRAEVEADIAKWKAKILMGK